MSSSNRLLGLFTASLKSKLSYCFGFRIPTFLAIVLCRLFRRKSSLSSPLKILVLRLDGLGDCVMTLPLVDELRRNFPKATISVATQVISAPIFEQSASVDVVLPLRSLTPELPRGTWNIRDAIAFYRRAIRPSAFDIAINPRWDVDIYLSTMLCNLTRAPVTVGYEDRTSPRKAEENRGFEWGYNVLVPRGPLQHEVLRNLDVLRPLNIEPLDSVPVITLTDEQLGWGRRWVGSSPEESVVVIGLPANAANRRWDAQHYINFMEDIAETHRVLVVMIADKATRGMAESVQCSVLSSRIAFGLGLVETMSIIANCDVYVGSDSGLAHISAALKRQTVVLSPHPIGGDPEHHNSPDRFRPYGPNAVVMRPKGRDGCTLCCTVESEPHCILDVPPLEVAAVVRNRLIRSARPSAS